jgi:4-hydroxybenzoate polyprenyltransferase
MSLAKTVGSFASLVKFSHTIFAMPFAMIGFTLGTAFSNEPFKLYKLLLVIACMITARNTAMAFNRWIDAKYDALNTRTAVREIPSGVINSKNAMLFIIVNSILFIVACFFINALCFALAPIALFVILFYSYTKRFTALCHIVLGVALALAPLGAYLAVTGAFNSMLPILFSLIVLCWVAGFDVVYALQDDAFDRSQNLHSIPAKMGRPRAINISKGLHALCVLLVVVAGVVGAFNFWYWIGACAFTALLIYQHLLIKPNDLSKINLSFFTSNGIGSVVFACFVIISILTA